MTRNKRTEVVLWIVQVLLALLFLFAGSMKLILPIEAMTQPVPFPGAFLRFIAVAEILGALGLVLPGLLGIRPSLTPLAATGLVIIMVGAVSVTLATGGGASSLFPLGTGVLAGFVAYGRWRLAPLRPARREANVSPAAEQATQQSRLIPPAEGRLAARRD